MARKSSAQRDQEKLEKIKKDIPSWYSFYDTNIENARTDREFLFLKQWTQQEESDFKRLQKPMLTINKTYDFYKRIIGEQRNNTAELEVEAFDKKATQQEMDMYNQMLKTIAFDSRNDIVYQTCFEHQISGSYGIMRVTSDFLDPKSFVQHIILKAVDEPEKVFFDPEAKEFTKRDGRFCGTYITMSRDDFKKEYPDIEAPASFPSNSYFKNYNWGSRDDVTLVEYYCKEYYSFNIHELNDGRVVTDKEYEEIKNKYSGLDEQVSGIEDAGILPEGIESFIAPEIVRTRKSRDYKIMYYKAIYNKILEKRRFPGRELPIVFVPNDKHLINGKEYTLSYVSFIKDPQRYLNYIASESAQAIKNNRREQFMVTPENIAGPGMELMWKNPSNQLGALIANPDPQTGQMPIKLPPSEIPASLLQQYERADMDIKSILGFMDANRGESRQELSGVALRERQMAGNLGIALFFDNLNRGIQQVGRIIMSMIPHIYDSERPFNYMNENNDRHTIMLNRQLPNGKIENKVRDLNFDVILKPGPSFAMQRQQSLEMLMSLAGANPQVFPLVADLIAENINIEKQPQLVERLKNLVPPQILAKESGQPLPPSQPSPQEVMAQQELQMKQQELALKQREAQLEYEEKTMQAKLEANKLMLQMEDLQTKRQMAGLKAGAEIQKASMDRDAEIASSLAKIANAKASMHKANASIPSNGYF